MSETNDQSIADRRRETGGARVFWAVLAGAVVAGGLAAWHVANAGLTLSHYDARAHLVVARRVVDSLTPGWRQFGAVWLPLPHLLNVVPVQWDWAYRTGAVAVAISVVALAGGLAALAACLFRRTGSVVAAVVSAAVILLNPNVLYLQSTPMTEPLLFGLSLGCLAAVDAWMSAPSDKTRRAAAWLLAALVLTRYEGWLVAAALVAAAGWGQRRRGLRELAALAAPAAGALLAFFVLSWASTGRWFLSTDFFVPDGPARHQPLAAATLVVNGVVGLGGLTLAVVGALGALLCLVEARRRASALLPLALLTSGLLPFSAFYAGHPFRIRYMVALVVAAGVLGGVALGGVPKRWRVWAGAALVAAAVWTKPPFDPSAPMVTEAQWETPFQRERERVSLVLDRVHDGTPILASMGSLAHYMHESSSVGLRLSDFLHEGNGDLWLDAIRSPRLSVHWVLIEERAEGGDMLAARARSDPHFLDGFTPAAQGGGLVLYRRD